MQYSLLIIIMAPLVAAVLIPWLGQIQKEVPIILSLLSTAVSGVVSFVLAYYVFVHGRISYDLGGWGLPWGIELAGDYISVILVITVSWIGFLAIIYSRAYVRNLLFQPKQQVFYYSLFCMLIGAMLAFLLAGDLFTMFVYLSVFSLSGVALIAISGENQAIWASFRYLLLSTTSGIFVLLGIAFLYYFVGTVNLVELSRRLGGITHAASVVTALSLIILGFSIKSALFPLHVWMPDAHAYAPSPVSAMLSGLVIEMGAYGMVRAIFFLFQLKGGGDIGVVLCWMAAVAILYGAIAANFQQDLKLIFAYSSVSQIGYIIMGISLASSFGLLGGLLHIVNHAVMKSALFLCAGALFYKTGWRTLRQLEGMGKQMPFTAGALALVGIAMIGVPPACGFVSEWYICLGAIEADRTVFAIIMLLGSVLSTVYYLRIVNSLFFKLPNNNSSSAIAIDEAPLSMLMPIWILALSAVGLGLFNRLPVLWFEKAVMGVFL